MKTGLPKIIVACDLNLGIGLKGQLPWTIPKDRKYFFDMTRDGVLCMGRKTYLEANLDRFKHNIIVVSQTQPQIPDPSVCVPSLTAALEMAKVSWPKKQVWICGGSKIYSEALQICDELYFTRISTVVEADTHFPPEWEAQFPYLMFSRQEREGPFDFTFQVWRKDLPVDPKQPERE